MKNIKIFLVNLLFLLSSFVYGASPTVYGGGIAYYHNSVKISGTTQFTPPEHSHFGWATTVYGDFTAISAPTEIINDTRSGAVYIYHLNSGDWQCVQKIIPNNPAFSQEFGSSLTLYKNTLLIGATGDDAISGAVYVYEFNGSEWVESQKLAPEIPIFFQRFGAAVDVFQDMLIISSSGSDETGKASGTIYIYKQNSDEWILANTILSPGTNEQDLFGAAIRIVNSDHILVAAPRGNGPVTEAGLVYSYIKSNAEWIVNQIISPQNGRTNGLFGSSMDYSNGNLIVGSMQAQVDSMFSGEANLYTLDENKKWNHEYRFIPETPNHHDYFGATVVIDYDHIIIASPKWDKSNDDGDHGTAYIYTYSDSAWQTAGQLIPEEVEENDHFGLAMALDGNNLVVGSSLDDSPHFNNGSSYFYDMRRLVTHIAEQTIPVTFDLYQNYPNPFNPTTTIKYNLPLRTHVTISIYNVLGRKIAVLMDNIESAGSKQVVWDGKNFTGTPVPSGTYIYRIETEQFSESKKMVLLK